MPQVFSLEYMVASVRHMTGSRMKYALQVSTLPVPCVEAAVEATMVAIVGADLPKPLAAAMVARVPRGQHLSTRTLNQAMACSKMVDPTWHTTNPSRADLA